MIYFLVTGAAVLAAVVVWFLLRPLGRTGHVEAREQYHQLQGVRDRLLAQLNEVDIDERDRNMEADTAADERARLEGELAGVLKKLDALAPESGSVQEEQVRSKKVWRRITAALALFVPLAAAGLYLINASVLPHRLDEVASVPAGAAPDPAKMVARLEKRLQENPEDLRGWLMLGRSYAVLGRLNEARLAYQHAYQLMPGDFVPDSPEAFWFIGLAAYNAGDSRRAIDLWQRLLAAMPPESDAAKQLRRVIEETKKKGAKK